MKILLIGSQGKMGKLFCKKVYENKSDQIVAGVDIANNNPNTQNTQNPTPPYLCHKEYKTIWSAKEKSDVVVDFSTASNKEDIINYALLNKIPLAVFSTTCSDKDKQDLVSASKHIPILLCPNTSIGINAMLDALNLLGNQISDCDIVIEEHHHKNKLDLPSGTAKSMENVLKNCNKNNIKINALRVGDECGFHSVSFFMQGEKITLSHTANSKEIFITGAVNMAKKLITKQNGFFTKL